MTEKLVRVWAGLQAREKVIILLGSALVLVTALYLVFSTNLELRKNLLEQRAALMLEQEWMQEQVLLVRELNNSCANMQILPLAPKELIELLASRKQLQIESLALSDQSLSLQLSAQNGNTLLSFIHESSCQGFNLIEMQVENLDSDLDYMASLEFRYES